MALEGTLNYLDIAHLLQVVGSSRKSGVLEISWQEREARLFFESGRLIRAESNRNHESIGKLLVEAGSLSVDDLDKALDIQRDDPQQRRLGAILCDDLEVSHETLQDMLRRQFEGIVFDIFSWPGGQFVFHFSEPEEVADRFHLNPVEFILEVGVQAGLLAERGVDRECAVPDQSPIALLLGDDTLARACADFYRRKAHPVVVCEKGEEVLGFLEQELRDGAVPVVLLDGGKVDEATLTRMRGQFPAVVWIMLADGGNQVGEDSMGRRGAVQRVRKPAPEGLTSPERESHLEVFLLRLDKTVDKACAELRSRRTKATV